MALAKNLHSSSRALLKLSAPSLSAAAKPRSFCVCKTAPSAAAAGQDGNELLNPRASGFESQTRTMKTTQRRLAAVEGTFRLEQDSFGELKVRLRNSEWKTYQFTDNPNL